MIDKCILLADNDQVFVDTSAEFLESKGYRVYQATDPVQARQVLSSMRIHLAILDLRLRNDEDPKDRSGLALAKETAGTMPKIILTKFPVHQDVREALKLDAHGEAPAVDFVDKREGLQELLSAVEQAFSKHVRINCELEIQWNDRDRLTFYNLVSLVYKPLQDNVLVQRANELQDLFRRLFYDYESIRIGRLFWNATNRFCVLVLAQTAQVATDTRILVCGQQKSIEQEMLRLRQLAPQTTRGTKLTAQAETLHFGAATYVLSAANIEMTQPFREFVQSSTERQIKKALRHLLQETLATWHQRGRRVEKKRDLVALYLDCLCGQESALLTQDLESRTDALIETVRPLSPVDIQRINGQLVFHFPAQPPLECPDPLSIACASSGQISRPVVCRISPGRLTSDNVLVDANQETWLTDFAAAGQAPQWWDFVCLEASIRFDLSHAPDLLAWLGFEECLVAPAGLQERLHIQDVIPGLRTNVNLIEEIRRFAGGETGQDIKPYYAGLLVWTLGEIARYDPSILHTRAEQMRGAHLLLAAALIARQLQEPLEHSVVEGRLRLDLDGTAWIADRRVATLVGQELELLKRLFEREGQILSREEIIERVLCEERILDPDSYDTRINNLVNRLRQDIELDPSRPRYVITVRGRGYYLCAEGTPEA